MRDTYLLQGPLQTISANKLLQSFLQSLLPMYYPTSLYGFFCSCRVNQNHARGVVNCFEEMQQALWWVLYVHVYSALLSRKNFNGGRTDESQRGNSTKFEIKIWLDPVIFLSMMSKTIDFSFFDEF